MLRLGNPCHREREGNGRNESDVYTLVKDCVIFPVTKDFTKDFSCRVGRQHQVFSTFLGELVD